MAETLSYQEPQNVTTIDNLTPEEQDSLAVGEKLAEQQDQLYAGKYKDGIIDILTSSFFSDIYICIYIYLYKRT